MYGSIHHCRVDAGGAAEPPGLWAEAAALITQQRRLPHTHRLYKGVGWRGGVKSVNWTISIVLTFNILLGFPQSPSISRGNTGNDQAKSSTSLTIV